TRPVEYLKPVPRSYFPQSVRNTLGSTLTVFRADVALPYLEAFLGERPPILTGAGEEPPEVGVWADEIEGQARGQILEALDNIEHHDFQVFVAGLLAALKYETRVGKKGADGGVDVLAYPDAFGLASPRIKIQVKNQKNSAGVQEVGYLNGVLGSGERGLFVCTGGFTKEAENAPFVRNGQVALVDGQRLLDLVLEHYEQMPQNAMSLLPLRRLYVPEKPAV
ncbi:MAG: restriction endonuclease, partial [Bacillota bacterium]|nr:restriction endonuclease [Bacillota bacterium]